jgi:hypothetical protein
MSMLVTWQPERSSLDECPEVGVVWFWYGFGMTSPRPMSFGTDGAPHAHAPRIGLLVPCTKRKRGVVVDALRIRSLPRTDTCSLAAEWTRRLGAASGRRPATDLYVGQGWAYALAARRLLIGRSARVDAFVLSAGLGLISADHPVPPYSATFSSGEDQVAARADDDSPRAAIHRRWLGLLHATRGASGRSNLEQLSRCDYVVAAMGAEYVEAAGELLAELADALGGDRLLLVSVGTRLRAEDPLSKVQLPVDTLAEMLLPGARSSLNQRLLKWIVEEVVPTTGWDRAALGAEIAARLAGASAGQPRGPRPVWRLDDSQVAAWIAERLRVDPDASQSRLLQEFRKTGSCEQGRFGRLVASVREKAARAR